MTFLIVAAAMGSLFVPARPMQGGRRAAARAGRTAQRLDAADAVSHDIHHHDPVSAIGGRLLGHRQVAHDAAPRDRHTPRPARTLPARVVPSSMALVVRDDAVRQLLRTPPALLPLRYCEAVAGRAPPVA